MTNPKLIDLKLVTPSGIIYESDSVDLVTLNTSTGEISIGHDHIPLVSVVVKGEVSIEFVDAETKSFSVEKGVLEIREDSEVFILVDKADSK